MLRRRHDARKVTIELDGVPIEAREGESVAAAILAAGAGHTRFAPVSGAPRAPYCMMGVCFECLVEIDGQPSQQACLVRVRPGLRVRRQQGPAALGESDRCSR